MRVALAQINPTVGDLEGNTQQILHAISTARKQGADTVLFPELALTGYPPEDLLLLHHFIEAAEKMLQTIINSSHHLTVIVGLPRRGSDSTVLYNSAAVIHDGVLLGFQDKSLLPTYDVFDEQRYFKPAEKSRIFEIAGKKIAVTICEDIWNQGDLVEKTRYTHDPIKELQRESPDVLFNLSASPFSPFQFDKRLRACKAAARSLVCPVYLCNQVGGNDSLIFDGRSIHVDSAGSLVGVAKPFFAETLVELNPPQKMDRIEELHNALVLGVRDYFHKLGFKQACLGLSGGIDSAVVACLAVEALGPENVLGVAMPSRYSSEGSVIDAEQLAKNLGIQLKTLEIELPYVAYLDLLKPHFEGREPDVTEENLQARIRANLLMAFSNKMGYILLSTGNKSEVAMGYSTLYGDSTGGLSVISDVVKRDVYAIAKFINRDRELIPNNTIIKPPSAELKPNQKDSDTLPDYEIIDTVLSYYVEKHQSPESIAEETGYDLSLVNDLIRKIHLNEYKRRQIPPGLRVTEKAFTVGRKFPIVQQWVP